MANSGNFWTKIEEECLINEYNINQLSIDEICIIHKRNFGGISARLIKLKIIKERNLARRSNIILSKNNINSETFKDNNFIWEMAVEQEKRIPPNPNKFQFFTEIISKVITQNDIYNKQIIYHLEKRINELEKNQLNSLD